MHPVVIVPFVCKKNSPFIAWKKPNVTSSREPQMVLLWFFSAPEIAKSTFLNASMDKNALRFFFRPWSHHPNGLTSFPHLYIHTCRCRVLRKSFGWSYHPNVLYNCVLFSALSLHMCIECYVCMQIIWMIASSKWSNSFQLCTYVRV
jgi:hypothetical protein